MRESKCWGQCLLERLCTKGCERWIFQEIQQVCIGVFEEKHLWRKEHSNNTIFWHEYFRAFKVKNLFEAFPLQGTEIWINYLWVHQATFCCYNKIPGPTNNGSLPSSRFEGGGCRSRVRSVQPLMKASLAVPHDGGGGREMALIQKGLGVWWPYSITTRLARTNQGHVRTALSSCNGDAPSGLVTCTRLCLLKVQPLLGVTTWKTKLPAQGLLGNTLKPHLNSGSKTSSQNLPKQWRI